MSLLVGSTTRKGYKMNMNVEFPGCQKLLANMNEHLNQNARFRRQLYPFPGGHQVLFTLDIPQQNCPRCECQVSSEQQMETLFVHHLEYARYHSFHQLLFLPSPIQMEFVEF